MSAEHGDFEDIERPSTLRFEGDWIAANEANYALVIARGPDGKWGVDSVLSGRLNGHDDPTFISVGEDFPSCIHPDDRDAFRLALDVFRGDAVTPECRSVRLLTERGATRWYAPRFSRIGDGGHSEDRIKLVLIEVTREVGFTRRTLAALDAAGQMYLHLDRHGVILDGNDRIFHAAGFNRDALIGCEWIGRFVPETDREAARRALEAALLDPANGSIQELASEILGPHGTATPVDWRLMADCDPDSPQCGLILFTSDSVLRHEVEQRERDLLRFPQEDPNPVFRVDRNGDIVLANESTQVFLDLVANAEPSAYTAWQGAIRCAKEALEKTQYEIDLTDRVVLFNIVPVRGRDYVNVYGTDITRQKRALESTRKALHDTIFALSAALEARDPYTAGHEERVAELAVMIGERMELSVERLDWLQMAALAHDVGKIRVPAEILSKPGKINDLEFQLIKTHAEVGASILGRVAFDGPIAEIVHQHHERQDGSGYPRGLSGDEILIEAAIIGIADTVEAMTSHRPYRAGLGLPAARAEIAVGAGTRYPKVAAEVCLSLIDEGAFDRVLA